MQASARLIRFSIPLLALFFICTIVPRAQAQWPPDSITNLRVLSKDIPFDSLVGIMAGFTRALGVRCSTCHVGEETQPISAYDFASDEKALKRKARTMLEMVDAINGRHLTTLESRLQPAVQVECFTCHRGTRAPRKLQEVLLAAWEAGGVDSLTSAYHTLRDRYYGRAVFSFDEVALADVSQVVEERGSMREAARLDALNVEMNPSSSFAKSLHTQRALRVAYAESDSSGRRLYDQLSAEYGAALFAEQLVNQLGIGLLRQGLHSAAIDVLRRNVERFPQSAGAHASLGQALAAAGAVPDAIRSFERALAIDPAHALAARRLRELRGRQEERRPASSPGERR
jgi:tetratricopeptide (TPR) repeat protein